MANKLIIFIILSLSVACGQVEDALAQIEQRRNPMLEKYTDFSIQNAAAEISQELNDALLITSDVAGQEWLDFMSGAQEENPDMASRGDNDLNEEKLTKLVEEKVREMYPEFNAENDAKRNVEWEKEGGYMTMLPYAINGFRELLRRHLVWQLFQIAKTHKSDSKESVPFPYPNAAMQAFYGILLERIYDYADHYKNEADDKIEKRDGELYIVNAPVQKKKEEAKEIVDKGLNHIYNTLYAGYHSLMTLQISLSYYLESESLYLWTYSLIAKAEESNELASRLADLTKKQIVMAKAGKNTLTLDQIAQSISSKYDQNRKLATSDNYINNVAPALFGSMLKLLNDEVSTNVSYNSARYMVRRLFSSPWTIPATYARKKAFGSPLTGNDEDSVKAAFHAFDILYEDADDTVTEEESKWWAKAVHQAKDILALTPAQKNLSHLTKNMFKTTFAGASIDGFFKELYGLVLNLAKNDAESVTADNLLQKLDAELDFSAANSDNYLLLKIYLVNAIPHEGFTQKVGKLSDAAVDKSAKVFETEESKLMFQAFRQGFGLLFSQRKDLAKADVKTKIRSLENQTLTGKGFTIMQWKKAQRVI